MRVVSTDLSDGLNALTDTQIIPRRLRLREQRLVRLSGELKIEVTLGLQSSNLVELPKHSVERYDERGPDQEVRDSVQQHKARGEYACR